MKLRQWSMALLLLLGSYAYAENFYAELSVGKAEQDAKTPALSVDGKDISLGLQLGYKFMPYLAVEGGYNQYGKVSSGADEAKTDALNLGLRLIAPLGKGFDFYLKGGLAWWKFTGEFAGTKVTEKNKDFYYAAGMRAQLKDFLTVGLEYGRLKFDFDDTTTDVKNKVTNLALTFGIYF